MPLIKYVCSLIFKYSIKVKLKEFMKTRLMKSDEMFQRICMTKMYMYIYSILPIYLKNY